MPESKTSAPLFSPFGLVLLALFALALLAAALSTRQFLKRVDLPPPGTYLVIAGRQNSLFVKLAQRSIKGLHRAVALRGQLAPPGTAPLTLAVRSTNSTEWEKKIKRPATYPGSKPKDIESNIVLMLETKIPARPELYGRTIPATFTIDMLVPRLDPQDPNVGESVPAKVEWTMQLQIQPPGFLRLYQKVNRIALAGAGAVVLLALVRQLFRRRKRRV